MALGDFWGDIYHFLTVQRDFQVDEVCFGGTICAGRLKGTLTVPQMKEAPCYLFWFKRVIECAQKTQKQNEQT